MNLKQVLTGLFFIQTVTVFAGNDSANLFYPGAVWRDDNGAVINAHGGGMLYHEGKYYWFGEHKAEDSPEAWVGVTCYSSDDLYHWTNEGVALPVVKNDPASEIVEGCIIERPKVIYNKKTQQFVMYFHLELKGTGYLSARAGIAVSDSPAGPYRYLKSCRPNGEMSRDMTLFVDEDGKAYHIYASEENMTLHLAELSGDYLNYTGKYIRIAPEGYNEAPAIFKKDGKYFMITSGCTGWTPNAARLFSAGTIWGPWEEHPNPCTGEDADLTFHSQGTYILPVTGKKDAFIFMADRWNPDRPIDGRYVWLPVLFENGLPVLQWQDSWNLGLFDEIDNSQKKIFVSDFGMNGQTADATPGVIAALEKCKKDKASELVFEKGVYHFYPESGTDKYCFVSNNDEGLKRIAFYLEDLDGLTVDGQGSEFIFHGLMNPFVVENSRRVSFRNFTIDFDRSFHSEGIILANHTDGIDLEIPENFPYRIQNGILIFTDGNRKNPRQTTVSKELVYPYGFLLEFDTYKRETAFMARDYYLNNVPLRAESIGERKVRVFLKELKGTVGNTLVFGSANRNYPGFIVSDAQDIRFENITIRHAGGMGIIGQRVHNVTVESCRVLPAEGRMVSATADATHFTNCTGKIELSRCMFRNQMDDATNIHGIYVQIREIINPNEVIVQLKHEQQLGFDFLKKGAGIEFIQGNSLITKGISQVTEAERINKELTRIRFSDPLPVGIQVGDAIGESADFADVYIHDNYIGKNRARGMLLNCRGKTLVENNTFHSPGAALLFEGDASNWFEQGGVKDCTIRNNVFDNCLFGVWGEAVIDVQAGITEQRETSRYNRNIKVYGNTFKLFDDVLLLHAYCMDNLLWENNKIERTTDYPASRKKDSYFKIENCSNMDIRQD